MQSGGITTGCFAAVMTIAAPLPPPFPTVEAEEEDDDDEDDAPDPMVMWLDTVSEQNALTHSTRRNEKRNVRAVDRYATHSDMLSCQLLTDHESCVCVCALVSTFLLLLFHHTMNNNNTSLPFAAFSP